MAEELSPSLKCIDKNNDQFFKMRSCTKTKVVKLRHTWTIHNFSFCSEKNGEFLRSPTFSARKNQWNDKSVWCLQLYPKGNDEGNGDFVSVFVNLVSSNLNEIQTEYALGYVNAYGEDIEVTNYSRIFVVQERRGVYKFVDHDSLFNQLNRILLDDNFTVYCEITTTVGIENISETLTTSKNNLSKVLHVSKFCENEYDDPIFKSTSSTIIKVVQLKHTWTINNFNRICENNGENLISPSFLAGKNRWNDKTEWCLKLYPKGDNKESSEYVSLYLEPKCSRSDIQTQYNLGIVYADGKVLRKFKSFHRFTKNEISNGYKEFIKRSDLYNKRKNFVVDDKLIIFCEITATACSDNTTEILTSPKSDLVNDFAFLLKSKDFSDVTLSTDGKEFLAHKVILAARSPVFKAMFQHDMAEKKNNRVEITDIDEEGLGELLRYIYTGEIHKLQEMAPRLLGMAGKYAIDGLKVTCEKVLFESVSVENAAEMFILSDTFRLTELKNHVKTFIVTNAIKVGNTAGFEMMIQTHPHLGKEAFCALSNSSII